MKRKIVELDNIPGFMELKLDLTSLWEKADLQTKREAEFKHEKELELRTLIDKLVNIWFDTDFKEHDDNRKNILNLVAFIINKINR